MSSRGSKDLCIPTLACEVILLGMSVRKQYINIKIAKLSSPGKLNNICVSGKDNGHSSVA